MVLTATTQTMGWITWFCKEDVFMKKKKKRGTQQNCVETYDIRVETTPKMELEEPALLSMRLGLMGLMILIMVSFTHSFCSIYGIDFFDYPNILLYALFGPVVR